ncbi:MAG: altronate dehydratase family protein [Prevotellaceae bacterium]|jgi:altronate hydrolase|nr:altronate dehydratase family protein [Prevotellaceae bacterium]
MMNKFLQIHPADNVAVAVAPLFAKSLITVNGVSFALKSDIPQGHKFALAPLQAGDNVIKYGYAIGRAIAGIAQGDWVNEKNIKTNLEGLLEYKYSPVSAQSAYANRNMTFKGYRRKNGEAGIRNELWIVPTVGCVNGAANQLAEMLKAETGESKLDAIAAYNHSYGCSQLGDDHENTRKILRDIVLHPNAGAVLVVGLGCENNQIEAFRALLGEYDKERIFFLEAQKVKDELEEGMKLLRELYAKASADMRTDVPLSELRVGLKCGGSDGLSGITANPLLGLFSDFLAAQGGATVLTEVPEMFGAETILMNRCESAGVFDKTVHLINDFKEYFVKNNQPIYENPSPGNKAGGISTLEEKSLGCTQKSGTSVVKDVLMYGERIKQKGLNLLSAPGNDLVAATALGAAGCQMVLFTTGRGTPFGSFVPTVKISTNTQLFQSKPGWIDFNAGSIVESEAMDAAAERLIAYLIEVANGEKVNTEKKNFREIAIFKTGVTL